MTSIVIDHVSRWYRNVVAVNDVSMTIGPGVTGLLGPNGAGKSTLIAMMSGFLAPSAGAVTLDGEPLWRNEQVYLFDAPHATRTPPTGDAMGVLYLVATAVTVLGSVGAMLLRYRKVQG